MHVYKSPLFIILLSPVKKQSYLYEERYMHRSNTIYQQNEDNRDGRFHWRKCWYGLWTRILAAFHFTRCQLMDWSGVDYCDVFISCLDSHSNGTHSLQRIVMWCNDTFLQICSHEETNSSASWIAWGWVHFLQIFIFGVNYSFKGQHKMAYTIHFIFIIWHI